MDKDRIEIEKELHDAVGEKELHDAWDACNYETCRDRIFLEVLLDIRDELHRLNTSQGQIKWASKI